LEVNKMAKTLSKIIADPGGISGENGGETS